VFDRMTQRRCRKKKKTTLVDFEGCLFFVFFCLRKERFWENSGAVRSGCCSNLLW
jgi:hypothetical protein